MEFNATFLISAISFVVFVFIMKAIFYEPLTKIINERNAFIDENFDTAKKNTLNSEKYIEERNNKINEANLTGKTIMTEKAINAKEEKMALIEDAKKQTITEIQNNQAELNQVYDNSKDELNSEVENISNSIMEKLFDNKINNEGIS